MPEEPRTKEEALRAFAAFQRAAQPLLEAAFERLAGELLPLADQYGVNPVIQIQARLPTLDEWEIAQEHATAKLPGAQMIPIDYDEARQRSHRRTAQRNRTARLN